MAPRQAAEIIVTELLALRSSAWERLKDNFEPQFQDTIRELVMDHVRHAMVGTKTIPRALDDVDIPLD